MTGRGSVVVRAKASIETIRKEREAIIINEIPYQVNKARLTEKIAELYYSAPVTDWLTAGADYQFIANPAYNPQRGPVSVLGVRLHCQF